MLFVCQNDCDQQSTQKIHIWVFFLADDSDTGESVGILRSAGAFARAIAPALTCSGEDNILYTHFTFLKQPNQQINNKSEK